MTNLNYKEFGYKGPEKIAGLVESARPELSTKPYTHYVFKIETADYKDKSSIEVSMVYNWWGRIKVTAEDGSTSSVSRDIEFLKLTIGTEVTAKEVMAELFKSMNAAVPSMKKHEHACITIELLNSHIDMTDFNNAYADDIDHVDQKLCTGNIFWIDDAKIMTFYC